MVVETQNGSHFGKVCQFLKKWNKFTIRLSNSRVLKTYSYKDLYTNVNIGIIDNSQKWVTT